jgi:hypothetical protein
MPRPKRTPTQTFDPEAIRILAAALDGAWESLKSARQLNGHPTAARTELAKHVMRMSLKGERDQPRLTQGALARFRRTSLNWQNSPPPPARPRYPNIPQPIRAPERPSLASSSASYGCGRNFKLALPPSRPTRPREWQ